MNIPRIVIGGVTSGAGKTTFATGLIAAFRRRGLTVQPFKCGPDYIDPSHLTRAAGRPARNLDSWMLPHDVLRELFVRGAQGADIAVIEGMMGLFDGRSGEGETGSTAEIAKLIDAPVLLVMDVGKVARSAVATALGFRDFDRDLRVAGVLLNQVGSQRHREMIEGPLATHAGLPALGALHKREDLALPERHLGLVPDAEAPVSGDHLARLAAAIEEQCDVDAILEIARNNPHFDPGSTVLDVTSPRRQAGRPRIAVAQDRAFSFYYPENLELLEASGAEVVPFSPLADPRLPADVRALYIGGGFPEVHAAALTDNRSMRDAVLQAVEAGMPVLGECGGLMYLAQSIIDFEGVRHPMAGAVPATCVMQRRRVGLGYLTLRARADTPFAARGDVLRAHEFHWSKLESELPQGHAAFEVEEHPGRLEGYASRNLVASYAHLHFGARPDLAPRFVAAAARWAWTT